MKRRSVILIVLIVVLPLAALTWSALRLADNEQTLVRQRYHDLMEERLRDLNTNVALLFEEKERHLNQLTAIDTFNVEELREITRTEPQLLQLFVLSPQGQLTYPNPMEDLNSGERAFLIQASRMFTGQDLKDAVDRAEQKLKDGPQVPPTKSSTAAGNVATRGFPTPQIEREQSQRFDVDYQETPQQQLVQDVYSQNSFEMQQFDESAGWFYWYWDRGLNLIYWQRRPDGHVVGGALERARWMADLVAQLPETVDASDSSLNRISSRIRLVNASANSVYQWGSFEPAVDALPFCEVPLTTPLTSWRLQCFIPEEQLNQGTGRSLFAGFFAGLAGLAVALVAIAFVFMREYARDMKQAAQQVSFVNQVSHELKTPLTNIRMYAELLESDLEKLEHHDSEKSRSRLNVILTEGQRLSRLIGNVLTFARQKRQTLQLQPRNVNPGQLVSGIVDRFRPAFEDQHIDIQLTCNCDNSLKIDPDFVEQILGNLISNVEKYAASGGLAKIECRSNNEQLTINVTDAGPGIDNSKRKDVFEPFLRVSNDVSYAAGTGIGLSIARELARLHGGDLELVELTNGCHFRATLKSQTES